MSSEDPQCFISYSWDTESHKEWVLRFAHQLVQKGVPTFLDRWDLFPGKDLPEYMESSIKQSQYVLLICTPQYAAKANGRSGGVGYEGTVITGELIHGVPEGKYVPILRKGDPKEALPSFASTKYYLDFRDDGRFDERLEDLLRHILGAPKLTRPALGKRPDFTRNRPASVVTKAVARRLTEAARPTRTPHESNVFVNCRFDTEARSIFQGILFTVIDCGFIPRTLLETETVDSDAPRIQRIASLIAESKYGIHDISYGSGENSLPRYNIPFELGLFLGAQRFGYESQRTKHMLILDTDRDRYQRFFSDIAGQDIRSHRADVKTAIRVVRDWLSGLSEHILPGGNTIVKRFKEFNEDIPLILRALDLNEPDLSYVEFRTIAEEWLNTHPIR